MQKLVYYNKNKKNIYYHKRTGSIENLGILYDKQAKVLLKYGDMKSLQTYADSFSLICPCSVVSLEPLGKEKACDIVNYLWTHTISAQNWITAIETKDERQLTRLYSYIESEKREEKREATFSL